MKKLTLIIAILLLGQVSAKILIVDQSGAGDATTIQAGINASADGDTVLVRPGTYIEGITFPGHKIYLIGSGADVTTIYYISVTVVYNGGPSELSSFTIESTTTSAIRSGSGSLFTIKHCIIIGSGSQIFAVEASNVNFYNNVIKDSYYGLTVSGGSTLVQNNVFENTNRAVYNRSNSTITVQNNIFIASDRPIYQNDGNDLILSIYNCYFNTTNTFANGTTGIGDIFDDPKFDDMNKSYLLNSDSPTRDAGNPAAPHNDGDGSRNDMGVYGGPNSWGTGPVITDLSISPTTINQGGTITIEATAKKK